MDIKDKLSDRLLIRWDKTIKDLGDNTKITSDRLEELRSGSGEPYSEQEKRSIDQVISYWEEKKIGLS